MKIDNIEQVVSAGKRIELTAAEAYDLGKIVRFYLYSTSQDADHSVQVRRHLAEGINEALV